MTVSEVARSAHVSRSTFYQHFSDLSEVFDAIVRDLVVATSRDPLASRRAHHACRSAGTPLCAFARGSRSHRALIHEDRFIPSLFQNRSWWRPARW